MTWLFETILQLLDATFPPAGAAECPSFLARLVSCTARCHLYPVRRDDPGNALALRQCSSMARSSVVLWIQGRHPIRQWERLQETAELVVWLPVCTRTSM